MQNLSKKLGCIAPLSILATAIAFSQTNTAAVTGRLTDSTGAATPTAEGATNAGAFDQTTHLDLAKNVGSANDQITVTRTAAAVATGSHEISTTLSDNTTENAPFGFGSYTLYNIGGTQSRAGTTYARNNNTGKIDYSGADAAVVINILLNLLVNVGGQLNFQTGFYHLSSCHQETVSPYTHYYAVGIPSTNTVGYPSFRFVGETAGIGSQVHPARSGVVFIVDTAAETCAGSGQLDAFWMRPNMANDTKYPAGGTLYWNDHVFWKDLAINFQTNTRADEIGIDCLEASYCDLDHVQFGFLTAATALGASGLFAYQSPATPSDGTLVQETQVDPGFNTGYVINTEHSVLINTEVYRATAAYQYGLNKNRNNSGIFHSGQWIHAQIYDCANGILVNGANVNPGAQLDILGLDHEYITTGPWAEVAIYSTGSGDKVGGLLTWNDVQTNVGSGTHTTPFFGSSGSRYTVIRNDGRSTFNNGFQALMGNYGLGSAIASAATIAPIQQYTHITGTSVISTITAPPSCVAICTIGLIPSGAFTTTTGGNIGLASTAVVGKVLFMTYDITDNKWYPSY